MPLKLRPATIADAPALTDIMHRAKASWGYAEETLAEYYQRWRVTEDLIQTMHFVVVEREGIPIAFSGCSVTDTDTLKIDYLFVSPDAQNEGLGSLLLIRIEDLARKLHASGLYTRSEVHSGGFYEKLGFVTVGSEPSQLAPGKTMPLMEKSLPSTVHSVSSIDLALSNQPWAFEVSNKAAIAGHFEEAKNRIEHLWNGRTLQLTGYQFVDGVFTGTCADSSFAAYLAWRDWGAPDPTAFNLFGSAILRTNDGALLYGVMSEKTATGGLIYPPGGNLDPTDLTPDGKVDVEGAIYRELEEETGLTREDVIIGDLLVAFDGPRISVARVFDVDSPANDLGRRIIEHSMASEEQELADIRIIRTRQDLDDPAIVPYARAFAEYMLS
ncbi:MAG: GNAT family N-acetyltransferase [Roseibium sp.]